jgi:hypothetical protein
MKQKFAIFLIGIKTLSGEYAKGQRINTLTLNILTDRICQDKDKEI